MPNPRLPDYSVSKAGVLMLSKVIAAEFTSEGIRSNVVSPAFIRSPIYDRPGGLADSLADEFGVDRETALEKYVEVNRIPVGRLGTVDEVASMVAYLASEQQPSSPAPISASTAASRPSSDSPPRPKKGLVMMFSKLTVFTCIVIVAAATLVGCASAGTDSGKTTIGVTLNAASNPFFLAEGKAIETAAAEAGVDVSVQYANADVAVQSDQIDTFIRQKVDSIIVDAVDSDGVETRRPASHPGQHRSGRHRCERTRRRGHGDERQRPSRPGCRAPFFSNNSQAEGKSRSSTVRRSAPSAIGWRAASRP